MAPSEGHSAEHYDDDYDHAHESKLKRRIGL
jgi:hypothetical protein